MAYTLGTSVLIGVLLGLVPVLGGLRINLTSVLWEEGRSGTSGRGTRVTHRALVVIQVAAAFVLLVGAGLLFASFRQVLAIDPGFNPAGVLTGTVTLRGARYEGGAELRRFTDEALRRVRAIPGVEAAGATSMMPLGGTGSQNVIFPEGYQLEPGESLIAPYQTIVTTGYFESMRVPLVAGRFFDNRDAAGEPRAVVVDEELARRFWPGRDPIGRRMFQPQNPDDLTAIDENTEWYTVIGVTGDVRLGSLVDEEDDVGAFYMAHAQTQRRNLTFTVRTGGDPLAVASAVRTAIASVDPALPVFDVRTMADRMNEALSTRRLAAQLSSAFGVVALLLSAVGLYGVLAYQVTQRTREIGIRIALGGSRSSILQIVLREGTTLVAVGLVLGAVGASLLSDTFGTELFGVQPSDPLVLVASVAVLAGVALAACGLPARRATQVDPVTALSE